MKVTGKNVVVLIDDGGTNKLYACATSATLNLVTEVIETSEQGSGKFATFLPTKNSFTGSLEGVTTLGEVSMLSLKDLRQKQIDQIVLTVIFQRTSGTDVYSNTGKFIITGSSDTGNFNEMNLFTIELQGTGPLSQDIAPPPVTIPFTYYYGVTELDTTAGSPLEVSFVTSVTDAVTVASAVSYQGVPSLTVVDFGGVTDKVLFLKVPDTEAPFTLWSETGNILQQNQPITSDFGDGSGAVWFRSVITGFNLYITTYQTTFTGSIIFGR